MFKKLTIYVVMAVLCQKKPKASRPKLKAFVLITLLLCLFNAPLVAQTGFNKTTTSSDKAVASPPELTSGAKGGAPLQVGDKLPEIFWTTKHKVYHNGIVKEENLLPFKGQILLIDFWASWCTNCINRFPKVAALSNKYQGVAKILLVNTKGNKDKIGHIDAVYQRLNEDGQSFCLPSIVEDTLINKLLKPTFLPHYVWVGREGKIVAITNSDFVSEEPIRAMHLQNLKLDSLRRQKMEAKP
ncbi:TlpA family protein disulfide reductase [Pedobacter helvus]|uniref:TlpA family protein disulfide reductase n=1 Tax=Pedobacter helvus TaxID=2563444 RepID=A0ABW9JNL0_9SPHI|nr:TlpA disulfide reductase family protein [Pedobacter ureilyticus]